MTNVLARAFPPPGNWQDFERLCFDLYSRHWKTSDAEMNGREGQPQAGVDIYGTDRVEGKWTGVQCKGKDQTYGNPLTVAELRSETEKAKSFRPALEVYVLATTAPNDAAIQQAAREITETHRKNGLFEVRVTGWTTLAQKVTDFPDLVRKYFEELAPVDFIAQIDAGISITRQESEQTRTLVEGGNAAILSAIEKLDTKDELQGRIANYAKLIEDGSPVAGIKALQRLWGEVEKTASPRNRYRLRANIGVGYLVTGRTQDAITEMRAAYAEDPAWPNARAILATAEMFSGNRETAFALAKAVLAEDLTINQAAAVLMETAPDDISIAQLETLIPATLRERVDIQIGLAHRARLSGDTEAQRRYIDKAMAAASTDWRVQAARAEMLLDPIFTIPGLSATHAVPPALENDLSTGTDLMRSAWAQVLTRDNARMGAYVAANLLSALDIAGRDAEYARTLDAALAAAPDYEPFLRRYAQRMAEGDDWAAAGQALDRIPADAVEPPDRVMRTQVRLHVGETENAIREAEAMERDFSGTRLAEFSAAIQIEAIIKAGKDIAFVNTILDRWPRSILLRSLAHNFLTDTNPRRATLLEEIRKLAETINDPPDRMHAADALFGAKQFSAAADMYQGLYTTDRDSLPLLHALRALFYSERRKEARALFESLSPDLRALPRYAEIGIAIYEHAGLLLEAKALLEQNLIANDTLRQRLHWISISERLGEIQGFQKWLATVHSDIAGAPLDKMALALVIDRHLGTLKAFDIGYRALRDGYDDPQVHLGYMIGLVFTGRARGQALPKPDSVGPDTAVFLVEKGGPRQLTRILETLPTPKIERDEIPLDNEMAIDLLGRKVGDEIEVPSLGGVPTVYLIKEIQHKYLRAHFRSLNSFETMFPGHKAFGSFQIDESKGDEKFKPLFDSVKQRGEFNLQLTEMYRLGQTPLMLMSRFSGVSPCETWDWVVSQPNLPMRVCVGAPQEMDFAFEKLRENDKVVVDPITLYGLWRMGIAEQVKACLGDLGLVQTTLDLLRRLLMEREQDIGSHRGTLGWDGSHYRMVEIGDDVVALRVTDTKNLLAFAETLTLLPAEPERALSPEAQLVFEDVDPAFTDTIYAAQSENRLLLTDDALLRGFAKEIAAVEGVWTQAVSQFAARNGKIPASTYLSIGTALAGANYRFTSVDSNMAVYQLQKDDWKITAVTDAIANQLAVPTNEPHSVIGFLVELVRSIWLGAPDHYVVETALAAYFRAIRRAQPTRDLSELASRIESELRYRLCRRGYETVFKRHLMRTSALVPCIFGHTVNKKVDEIVEGVRGVLRAAVEDVSSMSQHSANGPPA